MRRGWERVPPSLGTLPHLTRTARPEPSAPSGWPPKEALQLVCQAPCPHRYHFPLQLARRGASADTPQQLAFFFRRRVPTDITFPHTDINPPPSVKDFGAPKPPDDQSVKYYAGNLPSIKKQKETILKETLSASTDVSPASSPTRSSPKMVVAP